jgi:hypothetical protein
MSQRHIVDRPPGASVLLSGGGRLAPQAFKVLRRDYGRAVCTLFGS